MKLNTQYQRRETSGFRREDCLSFQLKQNFINFCSCDLDVQWTGTV